MIKKKRNRRKAKKKNKRKRKRKRGMKGKKERGGRRVKGGWLTHLLAHLNTQIVI